MTELIIKDGNSSRTANVTEDGHLEVDSISRSIQNFHSGHFGRAFQVEGTHAITEAGTHIPIHIVNNDSRRDMHITYIRWQLIGLSGGASLATVGNYLRPGFGDINRVASGGSTTVPITMNPSKSKTAAVTATQGNPTLTGSPTYFDTWYPKTLGEMYTWNKEGSVILGQNRSIELALTTDHTSGLIWTRISFIMVDNKGE